MTIFDCSYTYTLCFDLFFREKQSLYQARGKTRDYERAQDQSGLWRALAFGLVGDRRETDGFVSNQFELVDTGLSLKSSLW